MPEYRYLRPPIKLVGIFQPPAVETLPEPPAWWPNDKHRVLTFLAPLLPRQVRR